MSTKQVQFSASMKFEEEKADDEIVFCYTPSHVHHIKLSLVC